MNWINRDINMMNCFSFFPMLKVCKIAPCVMCVLMHYTISHTHSIYLSMCPFPIFTTFPFISQEKQVSMKKVAVCRKLIGGQKMKRKN